MERIVVLGTSGSGKTTLAKALSRRLGMPHVELDALYHERGWREADPDVFRERIARATTGDRWVVDGNYGKSRDAIWPRATRFVWLDLPRHVVMWRVVRRSLVRGLTGRELWNGNRERPWHWFAADHPIRYAWNTHARRRREYAELSDERWVRLRSAAAARDWLASLSGGDR